MMRQQLAKRPQGRQQTATPQHANVPALSRSRGRFSPQTQRLMGNHTVLRHLGSGVIQAKLAVGTANDQYEQEADRVAEQVISMREFGTEPSAPVRKQGGTGVVQRKCACGGASGMSGECEECSKKKRFALQTKLRVNEPGDIYEQEADRIADQVMATPAHHAVSGAPPRVQRFSGQPNGQMGSAPASVEQALSGPGRPLEPSLRQDMEQRFGHDFSHVRVHTGSAAEQSARGVNAHAYTVGHNIVFGPGRFALGTPEGQRLLAHELTHVVQQSGADGLRAGQSNERRVLSADYSIARKPRTGATVAAPPGVKTMTREEARTVLAAYIATAGVDDTLAAMSAIEATLRMPFTLENASTRLRLLTAAFSLLDEGSAASVLKALSKPVGAKQKHLRERFDRLDWHFRMPLLEILRERAGAKPVHEAEQADKPSEDTPAQGKTTWIELHPGVFAYLPNAGTTVDNIAAYLSGHPDVPDALAKLNSVSRTTPIPEAQPVIVPIEFIDRPKAIQEMPEHVRSRIALMRETRAQQAAHRRFVQVRSGHPLGPGAVGLIPLTTLAIKQIASGLSHLGEAVVYVIAFVAGMIHGFLKSIWDAVAGIAHMLYSIAKSLLSGELISDVKNLADSIQKLSWEGIKETVGAWAADWDEKLKSGNPSTAGHAHGYLTGYVMAEAAMLLLSGGAIAELKGAMWTSKLGEAVKASRALRTLESSIAKVAQAGRAAGGEFDKAIDVLRKSRLGKVVKAAEVTGAAVVWTTDKVKVALNLPADIVGYVAEKTVAHVKQLEPFFARIQKLSNRAKRWLFGCHSPCEWEADAVGRTMNKLTNEEIEVRAAAKRAAEAKEHRRALIIQQAERRRLESKYAVRAKTKYPAETWDYIEQLEGAYPKLKGAQLRPLKRPATAEPWVFNERMQTSQGNFSFQGETKSGKTVQLDDIAPDGWVVEVKYRDKTKWENKEKIVDQMKRQSEFARENHLEGVRIEANNEETMDIMWGFIREHKIEKILPVMVE